MKKNIAVLPGDGIGAEVVEQAVNVLRAIENRFNREFSFTYCSIGGEAIDLSGSPLPCETLRMVKKCDAVLLGAVGGSKWDNLSFSKRPEAGLLSLRRELKVFANIRPIKAHKALLHQSVIKKEILDGIDFIIIRELTGGLYFGDSKRTTLSNKQIKAIDSSSYSTFEIERVAKIAFTLARKRRKKITSVDKANVLETSRLWRETVETVAIEYPTVTLNHLYVDNATMQIIKNPKQFDVILTQNMFGDILSDEASVLSASIGMLPSASIGDNHPYLYEPIHGSAPKHAGKNCANPIGTILSVALMLRYSFNLEKEAQAVENAVEKALEDGARTYDIASRKKIVTTSEMGDIIALNIHG